MKNTADVTGGKPIAHQKNIHIENINKVGTVIMCINM
jgi:hypothetical protein